MAALTARTPAFRLIYRGKDITEFVVPEFVEVVYTDVLEDETDTLEVTVADPEGRWRGPWWPGQGDEVALSLGWDGKGLAWVGSFVVDQVRHTGLPDQIRLHALAAAPTQALRSNRHVPYEATDFKQLAEAIAARRGLTVVGEPAPIPLQRLTQGDETDLEFLRRIAREFGYVFNVKGERLIFHELSKLHALPAALTVDRSQLLSWELQTRWDESPQAVSAYYWDAQAKELRSFSKDIPDGRGDELRLRGRSEDQTQARLRVEAAVARAQAGLITGEIELIGEVSVRAGINLTLTGLGKLDGRYRVDRAVHRIDRGGGYVTRAEIKRLPEAG